MRAHERHLFLLGLLLVEAFASPTCSPSDASVIQLSLGDCSYSPPNQRDVNSWGILTSVGDNNNICVVPSTVVANTFLMTEGLCGGGNNMDANNITMTDAQCRSRRGGLLPASLSLPAASTEGLKDANQGWTELSGNIIDSAAEAALKFFEHAVTMVVVLVKEGQQSTASHLGLGSGSVLLQSLKEKGLITARSFGLNVGSQSSSSPRRGSLILGGYDQASVDASSHFAEYNITPDSKPLNGRHCPLQVRIKTLTLRRQATNSTAKTPQKPMEKVIIETTNGADSCLEPYDNLFRFSTNAIDSIKTFFKEATGYSGNPVLPEAYKDKLYNLEPGLVYPEDAGFINTTMRIMLEGGITVDIPPYELQRYLKGLDGDGNSAVDRRYTELQIYGEAAPNDASVLGKAFLSQVYLFVDYETGKFRLYPQLFDVTTPIPVSSGPCSSSLTATDKGLIAVGTVLGVLIVALIAFAFYRYCWVARAPRPPSSSSSDSAPPAPTEADHQSPVISLDDLSGTAGTVGGSSALYHEHALPRGSTIGTTNEHPPSPVSPGTASNTIRDGGIFNPFASDLPGSHIR